ncbi:MAG: hypothetical protein KTQ49_06955 [Candidatus Omnitrophica bacterium]|nr:hypothetical protein [Candidatus Omnitrophota bacterium]
MELRRALLFWLLAAVLFAVPVHAREGAPEVSDFSLALGPEWVALPAQFQNVVASYGKKGTLATFYITAREFEDAKTVRDLRWEDLFAPQFDAIDIRSEGETVIGGEKARYCLYALKPGPFKTAMEGKLAAKYMNYVMIRRGKLYSVTFKDTQDGFSLNYPAFIAAVRSLRFETLPPAVPVQDAA